MLRALVFLLVAGLAALLAAKDGPGFALVSYGVYGELETTGRVEAQGSGSGSIGVVSEFEQATPSEVTDEVTAAPGVRFGYTFVANNVRSFDSIPVEIRVTHPPLTLPDGRVTRVDTWPAQAQGIPRFTGWMFEHAYELVPGDWTIAVLHDGAIAVEKTFRVSLPGAADPRATDAPAGKR